MNTLAIDSEHAAKRQRFCPSLLSVARVTDSARNHACRAGRSPAALLQVDYEEAICELSMEEIIETELL